MSTIQAIEQRRSVRSYTDIPLRQEDVERIESYIAGLEAPFGRQAHIRLVRRDLPQGKVKLGTYGVIGGAQDYLTLCCGNLPLDDESAGYVFEKLILFCTSIGLGTCWLGGSFSRKDFGGQVEPEAGERIRAVSPVGYANDRKRLWDVLIGAERHHTSRKPFDSLFFHHDFLTPLTEKAAGIYYQPLEMVRRGPSANNFQPWRVVVDAPQVHFFHRKTLGGFDALDSGIALAHFGETCRELALAGHFEVRPDHPVAKDVVYSATWIAD
ncbi:MAG: hypothetical protein LBS05_10545 [Tannerellaceae bacterium]|nr:hypothetical protein [Tannerellaceae bacterium]